MKRSSNLKEPRFYVGIGAQKAGTTWLHHYLDHHPQVSTAPEKEMHYFDARFRPGMCGHWDEHWRSLLVEMEAQYRSAPHAALLQRIQCIDARVKMIERPELYRDYFGSLIDEDTNAFGEITPSYSLLPPEGFQEILRLFPEARFFFIARDPVDRFLSQVRFTCKRRNIIPRDDSHANDLALSFLDNPHFIRRSDYRTTLTNLLQVVPEDRLLVLFYEHLFDPKFGEDALKQLCKFLGISFRPTDLSERLNATHSVSYDPQTIDRVRVHAENVYEFMRERFGDQIPEAWR